MDCDHAETFSKDSQLEWLEVGRGNIQLELCKRNLESAYIYSNSSLSLLFEVFPNTAAFILQVLCSQHDAIFITRGGESAHHVQVKGWWVQQATSTATGRLLVTV